MVMMKIHPECNVESQKEKLRKRVERYKIMRGFKECLEVLDRFNGIKDRESIFEKISRIRRKY